MFGYVRPYQPELKCKDFELYKATYCGLCRCLRLRYGWLAPMFLTYDFTFFALLLWESEESFTPCVGRCHANLFRKKRMCPNSPALELAADESMILTYWKIQDAIQDESFWRCAAAKGLALCLGSAYRKAASLRPEFDQSVRENLQALNQLEKENCSSLDRSADTFAKILCAAIPSNNAQERILTQILYHVGRWIYLIDAQDDLEKDREDGRFNPIIARYGHSVDIEALSLTMTHSLELAGAALQLGEFGCRKSILENIFYLGMPLVQKAVFDGSWTEIKKQKIWRQSE